MLAATLGLLMGWHVCLVATCHVLTFCHGNMQGRHCCIAIAAKCVLGWSLNTQLPANGTVIFYVLCVRNQRPRLAAPPVSACSVADNRLFGQLLWGGGGGFCLAKLSYLFAVVYAAQSSRYLALTSEPDVLQSTIDFYGNWSRAAEARRSGRQWSRPPHPTACQNVQVLHRLAVDTRHSVGLIPGAAVALNCRASQDLRLGAHTNPNPNPKT